MKFIFVFCVKISILFMLNISPNSVDEIPSWSPNLWVSHNLYFKVTECWWYFEANCRVYRNVLWYHCFLLKGNYWIYERNITFNFRSDDFDWLNWEWSCDSFTCNDPDTIWYNASDWLLLVFKLLNLIPAFVFSYNLRYCVSIPTIPKKPKGLWHSCHYHGTPSELNQLQSLWNLSHPHHVYFSYCVITVLSGPWP